MTADKSPPPSEIPAIVAFAKNPFLEPVKTRLAKSIGTEAANRLYRSLLRDSLKQLSMLPQTTTYLACSPSSQHKFFTDLADEYQLELIEQSKGNLGKRMLSAIESLCAKHSTVSIVGTDIPLLPLSDISSALSAPDEWDVLLGPTYDGGYYFIGMKHPQPEIFANIEWSTSNVLAQTYANNQLLDLRLRNLPLSLDIDEESDLTMFSQLISNDQKIDLDSWKLLKELGY